MVTQAARERKRINKQKAVVTIMTRKTFSLLFIKRISMENKTIAK
jgi:hypothetical protein